MLTREQEKDQLVQELDAREAGVADLFQLYDSIESVYMAASEADEMPSIWQTTNSANNP